MKAWILLTAAALATGSAAAARKAQGYICQIKNTDGILTSDPSLTTRKSCKKSGGRWLRSPEGQTGKTTSQSSHTATDASTSP